MRYTLPETNMAPKIDSWKVNFHLGWPIFRGELLVSGRVERPNLDSQEVLEDVILDGREFFLVFRECSRFGNGWHSGIPSKTSCFFFFFRMFSPSVFPAEKNTHTKKKTFKQTGSVAGFAFGAKLTGKLLKDLWIAQTNSLIASSG